MMQERVDHFDNGQSLVTNDLPGVMELRVEFDDANLVSSSTDPKEIKKALTKQVKARDNRPKSSNQGTTP